MSSLLKFFPIIIIFIVAIVLMANYSVRQTANVTSIQEVNVGTDSLSLGEARTSEKNVFDKEALVSNLIVEIAKTQKAQGKDIKISYVFLDNNGNVTNDDNQITSVQFKIDLLDKNGEVISTSEQRISLKKG